MNGRGSCGDKNDPTRHHGGTRTLRGSSSAEDQPEEGLKEPSLAHGITRLKHGHGGGIPRSGPYDSRGQTNDVLGNWSLRMGSYGEPDDLRPGGNPLNRLEGTHM